MPNPRRSGPSWFVSFSNLATALEAKLSKGSDPMSAFAFAILALLSKSRLEINSFYVRAKGLGVIALILLAYWFLRS
jgi:hypothetical protein